VTPDGSLVGWVGGACTEPTVVREALAALGRRGGQGRARRSSSQEEIAVAILAELVAWRHTKPRTAVELVDAVDPVCGMTVSIADASEAVVHAGRTYYVCGGGCRARFEADPARYLATA
jgi:YHS domain-containing protein